MKTQVRRDATEINVKPTDSEQPKQYVKYMMGRRHVNMLVKSKWMELVRGFFSASKSSMTEEVWELVSYSTQELCLCL